MSALFDGEWSAHQGGYTLKLGTIFLGKVSQRGGEGIYAKCWVVTLNNEYIGEFSSDPDYARGIVERLICQKLEGIVAGYRKIKGRAPPPDCFWGQDSYSRWYNWKEDRAAEGRVFVQPTPRQIHADIKAKR